MIVWVFGLLSIIKWNIGMLLNTVNGVLKSMGLQSRHSQWFDTISPVSAVEVCPVLISGVLL